MLNQLLEDINAIPWPIVWSRAAMVIGCWLVDRMWERSKTDEKGYKR